MDKLLKPSEIKTTLTTLSGKQSNADELDVWLAVLMADTRRRYPNQALTPETVDAYLTDWATLVKQYGQRLFQQGLEVARMECEFFPSVAAIKKAIEAVVSKRTERLGGTYTAPSQADWDRVMAEDDQGTIERWKALVRKLTGKTA